MRVVVVDIKFQNYTTICSKDYSYLCLYSDRVELCWVDTGGLV